MTGRPAFLSGRRFAPVRRLLAAEEGAITAEFAMAAPAVLLLLGVVLAALGAMTEAIRLTDAAGIAARAHGRGDTRLVHEIVDTLVPGARVSVDRGELVCVTMQRSVSLGPFHAVVPVTARGCAAPDGA